MRICRHKMFVYCPPKNLDDLKSETIDGKRYYTLHDGSKLASVTTVIGAMKKKSIYEWRQRVGEDFANKISARASRRGTNMHTLCERYLRNESLGTIMPDAKEMFYSIQPLLNNINNIHYQETALWSKTLGMAGRVDCIAEYEGVLSVIDFKTSSRVKTRDDIFDYFWQETAYALMYKELIGNSVKQLVTIMAVEGSEPLVFKERTIDHIPGLVDAINFYKNSISHK